jgi:hypothetical protein
MERTRPMKLLTLPLSIADSFSFKSPLWLACLTIVIPLLDLIGLCNQSLRDIIVKLKVKRRFRKPPQPRLIPLITSELDPSA